MPLHANLEFEFEARGAEVPRRGPGLKAPFGEQLLAFDEFGKKTVLAETTAASATVGGKTWSVPTYVNEFWTAKQRAASRLHEISYRACFKPQLPRFFIERLTEPGDLVHDPFMGRGTTLLEAALLGRVPCGCDVNPLSLVLVRPRLRPPTLEQIRARLAEIDFTAGGETPDDLLVFFHPETLREIAALKRHLLGRGTLDPVDEWIALVALNRLTGHSPGFFSVYTLPPNQAVLVKSQRKINADRGQTPPLSNSTLAGNNSATEAFIFLQFYVALSLCLWFIWTMERLFDSAAIRTQIANLTADRDRINGAIQALEEALQSIESEGPGQPNLRFASNISLNDAVTKVCVKMVDAITRQRVVSAVENAYFLVKPNPSSVAAALTNLAQGEHAMLKIVIQGRGSAPTVYSTEGDMTLHLNAEEIKTLMDPATIRGTGGWQSLWLALQRSFDKAKGDIKLTPELRVRIHHYYHNYGIGGWQTKTKQVFRRELPHLFVA
jgi:hypothetical protein